MTTATRLLSDRQDPSAYGGSVLPAVCESAASAAAPGASAEDFRAACRLHAAGIAVITATGSDGPVGFAASSFAGLSAEPPLVSFNIGRASSSLPTFLETETAMVHLLGDAHSPLVQRFAGPAASRFADDGAWSIAETGEPVLHAVRARLRVSLDRMIEAGDHLLVIAGLLDLEVIEPDEAPLVHTGGAVVTAGP